MESLLDRAGLVYEVVEPGGGAGAARGTTIVLRGVETDPARLTALARAAAPAQRLVVPQPLRFLYLSRAHVGQRWFVTSIDGEIEPATFADALYAVEQLTVAAHEQWGEAPLLVGHGQGGELALALAALIPERLSGVVAFDAALPEVPGWERPDCSAEGLRVALLAGGGAGLAAGGGAARAGAARVDGAARADAARAGAPAMERTRRELVALGAHVELAGPAVSPARGLAAAG